MATLIEYLENEIILNADEPEQVISWPDEIGILISKRNARLFVELLKKCEQAANTKSEELRLAVVMPLLPTDEQITEASRKHELEESQGCSEIDRFYKNIDFCSGAEYVIEFIKGSKA